MRALKDINELLATRLAELNKSVQDAHDDAIRTFLKLGNKQDRELFKKNCDENEDLKQSHLQYLRL